MIDSHTHLGSCEPDDAELVASAAAAGVRRMLTVGMDADSCRLALASAQAFPSVYAAIGRHPNSATGFGDDDLEDLRGLAAHPRCAAIGETGLDYYRDSAPPADQLRAFHAHIELARELGKPLVVHCREAGEDTIATLSERAAGVEVIMHCFSLPERVAECVAHGWWISFAGNLTYPKSHALRAAACEVPGNRLLVETDAPYLTPQAVRKQRNQPAYVVHTAAALAAERGVAYDELEATLERNAAALFGW